MAEGTAKANLGSPRLTPFASVRSAGIQFRAEAFNLFNHANFDLPSNSEDGEQIFTLLGFDRPASAGRIFSTVGDAREIQVGLKFLF